MYLFIHLLPVAITSPEFTVRQWWRLTEYDKCPNRFKLPAWITKLTGLKPNNSLSLAFFWFLSMKTHTSIWSHSFQHKSKHQPNAIMALHLPNALSTHDHGTLTTSLFLSWKHLPHNFCKDSEYYSPRLYSLHIMITSEPYLNCLAFRMPQQHGCKTYSSGHCCKRRDKVGTE